MGTDEVTSVFKKRLRCECMRGGTEDLFSPLFGGVTQLIKAKKRKVKVRTEHISIKMNIGEGNELITVEELSRDVP